MSSKRLPGKVLKELVGKPILRHLIDNLNINKSKLNLIIATSTETSDDPIQSYCEENKYDFFRGDLNNVASRFSACINKKKLDFFVRICADSPLIDHRVVDEAVDEYQSQKYDLVTNVYPRSFPKGISCEVLNASVFTNTFLNISDPDDLEHVTKYFYNHKQLFKIKNISAREDYSNINFSCDTIDDYLRIEKILKKLDQPTSNYNYKQLANFIEL